MAAFAEIGYTDYAYAEIGPYRYHSEALIGYISRGHGLDHAAEMSSGQEPNRLGK